MNPTVAVVAQGAMGAGVGARLVERGLHVITSLAGRSEASTKRAKQMYRAIADFYTRIAADHEGKHEETGALAAFLKKKD